MFGTIFGRVMGDFAHLLPAETVREWVERNIRVPMRGRANKRQPVTPDLKTYLSGRFCYKPFETLETSPSGLLYLCCPGWLPTPAGDVNSDILEQWRGPKAKKIRDSIIDGSFRYCSPTHCPAISGRTLPSRDTPEARALIEGVQPAPKVVTLSHDRSCNLSCPSCRTEMIVANKSKQQKLDGLIETSFVKILKVAESVWVTGSGDPFASNHFRRLLKRLTSVEFPKLKINLLTNGLLCDERAWADLDLEGRVDEISISIDAAEPQVYSIMRRGGDFERLKKNLAFIKTLRERGAVRHLTMAMVVENRNFSQAPAFVRFCKGYGADVVSFSMIRNWGTYSAEAFKQIFVAAPDHPNFPDFVRMLEAPEMTQPGVDSGNLYNHVALAAQH